MKELCNSAALRHFRLEPAQPVLDLCFPILEGRTLEVDHGHALQTALSRHCPDLERIPGLGIHPVRGTLGEVQGELLLSGASEVRVRLPEPAAARLRGLAGAGLEVGGHAILGTLLALAGAAALFFV